MFKKAFLALPGFEDDADERSDSCEGWIEKSWSDKYSY